ncbi:MAG: DUF6383 domain-containing protein [Tannerella sp.]|nr:DUF6383 domain-containing protein [Tannerella sp.]
MNRKIFTLLACALMLFSTAFTINAKVGGGNLAVGDLVRSLPMGEGKGMYHIQVDAIYRSGSWIPVSGNGGISLTGVHGYNPGDTVVLAVTENARVILVSANDLRHNKMNELSYVDLQSTMWCVNIEEKTEVSGQLPTFHFTNKVFGQDLDFSGTTYADGTDLGWMYSIGYDNGQLGNRTSLRRLVDADNYRVLYYTDPATGDGFVGSKVVLINNYLSNAHTSLEGMLRFSIVEVAPIVLDAAAFNTKLGAEKEGLVTLKFENPEPNSTEYPNYFGYPLKAVDDPDTYLSGLGYLNLYVNGSDQVIYNSPAGYTNTIGGVRHLRIYAGNKSAANNNSYRFVYFPSRDSLVINALKVNHNDHGSIANGNYSDSVATKGPNPYYKHDAVGDPALYYGLYTPEMQDRLIVRLQDLYGTEEGTSLMTIGKQPANTHISFGVNNCNALEIDAWVPSNGIYTIWDDRGRMLGVRPYNGALAAQWIELKPGECPDRIPSYQWVIERAGGKNNQNTSYRVNITNREFGTVNDYVQMKNVLITEKPSRIFGNQGQFHYHPLVTASVGYEAINYANVTGQYIDMDVVTGCVTVENSSGFRPVRKEYVRDQYLGYKHFYVNGTAGNVSFGKSDNIGAERGMDYNAFMFNYLHEYKENGYIALTENAGDKVLHVSQQDKEGFQFRLGSGLNKPNFETEKYGYGHGNTSDYIIKDTKTGAEIENQGRVPRLERYYYELKVADFYNYRDSLAEQYVVLKGASGTGKDLANKFNYGVANVYAETDPFKFANIYLRETYFLERDLSVNEERKSQDPDRRIFYALIDRIEPDQFHRLSEMGYELIDTLKLPDQPSSYFGLLMLRVDPASGIIKGVTKTITTEVMSTFALENKNYPLYRRLRSKDIDYDNADPTAGGLYPLDAPKTLRFHKQLSDVLYLYEDGISSVSDNLGINFLGQANIDEYPEDIPASDGTYKYNYNLFVDTAYINRGTGWIKPQYLIAVGWDKEDGGKFTLPPAEEDPECEVPPEQTITILPYIKGRYLINATDSAREIGSNAAATYPIRDNRYITSVSWNRLAFVDAIHVDDRLYIVSQLQKAGISESDYTVEIGGKRYVDGTALRVLTQGTARTPEPPSASNRYGTYYDLGAWQNYHNDVCFSFRFVNADAQNPDKDGNDFVDNDTKAFMIESETTNRNPFGNRKIAPVQGGWIVLDNGVPAISHIAYEAAIGQAEVFNVKAGKAKATSNDPVSSDSPVKVISGTDEISVQNVAGKQVTITNLLGQTIANIVPNSDNVTVKAPKGIVIVTVKGEKTVKSIVK